MNQVKIKYSEMNNKTELCINGEMISAYSDMTALVNRAFHEVADQMIKVLDREIFDDYEIELYGMDYQYEVLRYYQEKSAYCKKITYAGTYVEKGREWRNPYLLKLAETYHLDSESVPGVKIYSAIEERLLRVDKKYVIAGKEEADIEVIEQLEGIEESPVKDFVLTEEKYSFQIVKGKRVFGIPADKLNVFLDYYLQYCLLSPWMERILNSLKYIELKAADAVGFQAARDGKDNFYLGELPSCLDVGEEVPIMFESFPKGAFLISLQKEGALIWKEGKLVAKEGGRGVIEITDSCGKVIVTKEITVISHRYVEEIRVLTEITYLNVNDRKKIEVVTIPGNAEDADLLKWEVEDYSIAHVQENGEIIALTEGKTKLRISTLKAVKEVEIEIKPVAQALRFKESAIRIKQGESVVVECEVIPPNASFENLQWSFDNEVIASIATSKDKKKCKIEGKRNYSGKGNLKCTDQKQNLSAVCNVEVARLQAAGSLASITITCLVMGFLCMPFMTPVATILSIIGLKRTEVDSDRKKFKICLIISSVLIILWVIMLVIAGSMES